MNRALTDLLQEKSFDYITIKEICQRAGVNRSTFYLHYENTCDLLEETTARMLESFQGYFPTEGEGAGVDVSSCSPEELNFVSEKYLYPYLRYIRENSRLFATALRHASTFGFEGIYQRLFRRFFDPILERFHYPEEHRSYVMRFYLNGINAIVIQWLQEDCACPEEEVAAIIRECIFGRADGAETMGSFR